MMDLEEEYDKFMKINNYKPEEVLIAEFPISKKPIFVCKDRTWKFIGE